MKYSILEKYEIIHDLFGYFSIDVIKEENNHLLFKKSDKTIYEIDLNDTISCIEFDYLNDSYNISLDVTECGVFTIRRKRKIGDNKFNTLFCYYDNSCHSISFSNDDIIENQGVPVNKTKNLYFLVDDNQISMDDGNCLVYFCRYGNDKKKSSFYYKTNDYSFEVTSSDSKEHSVLIKYTHGEQKKRIKFKN